jgi:hypothetical protein
MILISFNRSINIIKKTCKYCKSSYDINTNTITSCKIHKGKYIGAEASKHSGTRSGGNEKGLLIFWDCCDQLSPNAIGCHSYYHISYDDDDNNKSYLINNYNLKKL